MNTNDNLTETLVQVTIGRSNTVHRADALNGRPQGTHCGAGAARNTFASSYSVTDREVTCARCLKLAR
jgi:hypothetical protein